MFYVQKESKITKSQIRSVGRVFEEGSTKINLESQCVNNELLV